MPAGARSDAIQSLVDLPVSFLVHAGLEVPGRMTGVDQTPVWRGEREWVCNHALAENLHQPGAIHLRTYVDARYKLTVYRGQPYGELYDLEQDPGEIRNLWDHPEARDLKARLLERVLQAELAREPVPMPRIAGA